MDFVNSVNYKLDMNNKNNIKTQEKLSKASDNDNYSQSSNSGIYLRDDHCDWGSSGMNEFTNEYSEDK